MNVTKGPRASSAPRPQIYSAPIFVTGGLHRHGYVEHTLLTLVTNLDIFPPPTAFLSPMNLNLNLRTFLAAVRLRTGI